MNRKNNQSATLEKPAISEQHIIVVNKDADLSAAIRKMMITKVGVVCIDFSEGKKRVVGVITPSSLIRAGDKGNVCVSDVMNRNFVYTTIEHIDRDVGEMRVSFMPVVDEEMNLLFVVFRESCHLWSDAQEWEFNWQRRHLEVKIKAYLKSGKEPYPFYLPEQYVSMIQEKASQGHNTCIEVGAGIMLGFIKDIPSTNKRIIIEPLCERYAELRKKHDFTFSDEESIICYPQGGDVFIPDLVNSADIILTQNVLDHSPEWPFILGNIAEYARKGCLLFIGNYVDHHEEELSGHFNITYNPEKYIRLIRQLGFEIIWRDYWAYQENKAETWVSCFARKL